jgi:hypothetical protein
MHSFEQNEESNEQQNRNYDNNHKKEYLTDLVEISGIRRLRL